MGTRIQGIKDPSLFQRLVHSLFAAERGKSFQVVDDSAGDAGNDGYDPDANQLIAIYCPEKEATTKKTLAKAREDLAKAVVLKSRPEYSFEEWVFITPEPLVESTQGTLRSEAAAAGLEATFLSGINLEPIYLRNPHLHDLFPDLEYPRIEAELRAINRKLGELVDKAPTSPSSNSGQPPIPETSAGQDGSLEFAVQLLPGFSSAQLAGIQRDLYTGVADAEHRLEQFRLETLDRRERIVALLIAADFAADQVNFEKVEELAAEGWHLAKDSPFKPEASLLAARYAHATAMLLSFREFDVVARLVMMSLSGAPMVTTAEAEWYDRDLPRRREEVNNLFHTGFGYARDSRNLAALYRVALLHANAVTHTALVLQLPGREVLTTDKEGQLKRLKSIMEAGYDLAITTAKAMSATGLLGTAYSNFANDLRSFGDKDRALVHARRALELATEAGDERQVDKTGKLIAALTSPS